MSREKRHMRCCGRWNTKFHRRCEKQIKVVGCGSAADGSASNSTGTPTRVSISVIPPCCNLTRDERVARYYGSATLMDVRQISGGWAVEHSMSREIDPTRRAWKDGEQPLDGDDPVEWQRRSKSSKNAGRWPVR